MQKPGKKQKSLSIFPMNSLDHKEVGSQKRPPPEGSSLYKPERNYYLFNQNLNRLLLGLCAGFDKVDSL